MSFLSISFSFSCSLSRFPALSLYALFILFLLNYIPIWRFSYNNVSAIHVLVLITFYLSSKNQCFRFALANFEVSVYPYHLRQFCVSLPITYESMRILFNYHYHYCHNCYDRYYYHQYCFCYYYHYFHQNSLQQAHYTEVV